MKRLMDGPMTPVSPSCPVHSTAKLVQHQETSLYVCTCLNDQATSAIIAAHRSDR